MNTPREPLNPEARAVYDGISRYVAENILPVLAFLGIIAAIATLCGWIGGWRGVGGFLFIVALASIPNWPASVRPVGYGLVALYVLISFWRDPAGFVAAGFWIGVVLLVLLAFLLLCLAFGFACLGLEQISRVCDRLLQSGARKAGRLAGRIRAVQNKRKAVVKRQTLVLLMVLLFLPNQAYAATTFLLEVGGADGRQWSGVQEFRSQEACMHQAKAWDKAAKQAHIPIVFDCVPTDAYEQDVDQYPKLRLVLPQYRRLPVGP